MKRALRWEIDKWEIAKKRIDNFIGTPFSKIIKE